MDSFRKGLVGERIGKLPSGRHGLPRVRVAASQRDRLLHAIVDVVGERGYAATTIADVTRRADVSKKTFYEYFDDKEQCFLAAYDAFADYLVQQISAAYQSTVGGWRERYAASAKMYLFLLAQAPLRTRALMLEVLAAGPKVLKRRRAVLKQFETQLHETYAAIRKEDSSVAKIPDALFPIAIGGIDEQIRAEIVRGKASTLPNLLPVIQLNFQWMLRPEPESPG